MTIAFFYKRNRSRNAKYAHGLLLCIHFSMALVISFTATWKMFAFNDALDFNVSMLI
jgi:hypothetical protein